jgi:serine/threonine protein kinase
MAVMDYANKGSLRANLTGIVKCTWKQRLHMLYEIISGLTEIHKHNLIHRDFHDGNILSHENKKNSGDKGDRVYISDLGLCQPVRSLKKDEIIGVIPFIAPEILRGEPYTLASDIYSFSMIMWEFTSGIPPFNDRAHDLQLSISICKGERPVIIENTPQCYVDLMKKCWNGDPLKRPTASEVENIIEGWIYISHTDISEELKSNIMEFINAPSGHNNRIIESHPQAYYTSRLHNFTSVKVNEVLASKSLDDCLISEMGM